MSHVVRTAVRRHSQATRATLAVLKELADFAHHDGVTWISQDALVKETTYSEREVRAAIRWLEEMCEIETRKAQRGRRRVNVYRVIVGPIGMSEPDYDRLPFDLAEPFSRPADIAGRRAEVLATPAPVSDPDAHPGHDRQIVPVADQVDDRQSEHLTTGSPTRACVTEDPSVNRQTREANASLVPADAGESNTIFEINLALTAALGVQVTTMTRSERGGWERAVRDLAEVGATRDQVVARCSAYRSRWPRVALTPMALVRHWSLLGASLELAAPERRIEDWIEKTAILFDAETAHELLDERTDLTEAQRATFHARIQERLAQRDQAREVA